MHCHFALRCIIQLILDLCWCSHDLILYGFKSIFSHAIGASHKRRQLLLGNLQTLQAIYLLNALILKVLFVFGILNQLNLTW